MATKDNWDIALALSGLSVDSSYDKRMMGQYTGICYPPPMSALMSRMAPCGAIRIRQGTPHCNGDPVIGLEFDKTGEYVLTFSSCEIYVHRLVRGVIAHTQ